MSIFEEYGVFKRKNLFPRIAAAFERRSSFVFARVVFLVEVHLSDECSVFEMYLLMLRFTVRTPG